MVLNVRRSDNKAIKNARKDQINVWKLLPGSQATVAVRPQESQLKVFQSILFAT